jgi:hypothetical protein
MYCSDGRDMALQKWSNLIDSSQIGEVILHATVLVHLFMWLDADCQAELIPCKLIQRRSKAVEKETSGIQVKVQPCMGRMTSCFGSNAISRTTDIWFGGA